MNFLTEIEDNFDYVLFSAPRVKDLSKEDCTSKLDNWAEGYLNVLMIHDSFDSSCDKYKFYGDGNDGIASRKELHVELFEAITESCPDVKKNSSVLLDCSYRYSTSAIMDVFDCAWNKTDGKRNRSFATKLTDECIVELENDGKTIKVLVFQID